MEQTIEQLVKDLADAKMTAHVQLTEERLAMKSQLEEYDELNKFLQYELLNTNRDKERTLKEMANELNSEKKRNKELVILNKQLNINLFKSEEKIKEQKAEFNRQVNFGKHFHKLENELEEIRSRLQMRINELENILTAMRERLSDEEQQNEKINEERRKQQETVRDLEEHLELEEQARQKLLLDKTNVDQRLRDLEEQLELEEQARQELLYQLTKYDEESANVALMQKQMRDMQTTIDELREDIETERIARNKAEMTRREVVAQLEKVKGDVLDKVDEATMLQDLMARKDEEVNATLIDRDNMSQELRDRETRVLSLMNEVDVMKEQLEESDRLRRSLQQELQDSISNLEIVEIKVGALEQQLEVSNGLKEVYSEQLRLNQEVIRHHVMQVEAAQYTENIISEQFNKAVQKLADLKFELDTEKEEKAKSICYHKQIEANMREMLEIASQKEEEWAKIKDQIMSM